MGRLWGNNGHGMAPQSSSPSSSGGAPPHGPPAPSASDHNHRVQGDSELPSTQPTTDTPTAEGNGGVDQLVKNDVEAQLQEEHQTELSGKEEDSKKKLHDDQSSKTTTTTTTKVKDINPQDDDIKKENIKKENKVDHQAQDCQDHQQTDDDMIFSSIQALPPRPSGISNSVSGQVGAHRVTTTTTTTTTRTYPPSPASLAENASDDEDSLTTTFGMESMESGLISALTNPTLVEAHLVTTNDDDAKEDDEEEGNAATTTTTAPQEVYQAEKISPQTMTAAALSSNRTKCLVVTAVLVFSVLVGTVVTLALKQQNKDNDGTDTTPSTASTGNPAAGSEGQEGMEKNVTTEEEDTGFDCFMLGSHNELYDAMTAYYEDPTPNSSIAQQYGYPIGSWCVSGLQSFDDILTPYRNETTFNINLSEKALQFALYYQQQDIGGWDLSNARTLKGMFRGIQNLSIEAWGIHRWDVSNARKFDELFKDTQWQEVVQEEAEGDHPLLDLSSWNTSSLKSMAKLFQYSTVERGTGIKNWDTSQVENLNSLAEGARNFNEDIGSWNTKSVTSMQSIFKDASNFNQDISQWNTSSLTKLNMAFLNAAQFNQPIGGWDTSKITTLRATFQSSPFNHDLSQWDVTKVTRMMGAFRNSTSFNQNIGTWNVSAVQDLRWMFESASNFSQNLCSWGSLLPPHAKVDGMFKNTACPNTTDPLGPEGPFCFNCN